MARRRYQYIIYSVLMYRNVRMKGFLFVFLHDGDDGESKNGGCKVHNVSGA